MFHKCADNVGRQEWTQQADNTTTRLTTRLASQTGGQPANQARQQATTRGAAAENNENLLAGNCVLSALFLSLAHHRTLDTGHCPCLLIPLRAWGKSLFSAKYFT